MFLNLKNRGQGTIEYLVILAVVVVIGLVVVSLSVGFFDSAGDISTTTRDISRVTTSGIVITDGVIDADGNIYLNLKNQTGQNLTLTGIDAGGTNSDYDDRITRNQTILLKAISENCKCSPGQRTTTCEIQFTYSTQLPDRKDPKILIELECLEQIEPTVPPIAPLFAGLCGNAINQDPFYETPTNNLCETGNPSTITYNIEDGNWQWTCQGSTQALSTNCSAARNIGDGTPETPRVLFTCQDLQNMNQNLAWHYALGNNIDCSETTNWNGGAGFEPIGTYITSQNNNPFTGNINGNNFFISNMYINRTSEFNGLFGYANESIIENIYLKDINFIIPGVSGGLAGRFRMGLINNAQVSGNLKSTGNYIGGLVGLAPYSNLSNSHFIGNITGDSYVGGLIGSIEVSGSINSSYSEGELLGTGNHVGGLVGYVTVPISNSHSKMNISSESGFYIGGLVGYSSSSIFNSYSTGDVSGRRSVGGLAGDFSGTILNSYANGNVFGNNLVGGFIGSNSTGNINFSYSTGDVTVNDYSDPTGSKVGGFVGGISGGLVSNSYAKGKITRTAGSNYDYGGFVGSNDNSKIFDSYSIGTITFQNEENPTNKGFAGNVDTSGNYEMSGNFFDMDSSQQNSTAGEAEGKTTLQMTHDYNGEDTFGDWDFEEIWSHDIDGTINDGYPYLKWQTE